MLVVALSMAAALLLGGGRDPRQPGRDLGDLRRRRAQPGTSPSPSRFLDALIGGAVALLVGQVLFPRDPVRAMGNARARGQRPVGRPEGLAEALRDGDEQRARRALEIARHTDDDLASFFDAVALARETFTLRRPRGRTRERLPLYAEAAQQMDYAVRNTRVLARRALARSVATARRRPSWPTPCHCSATPCSSSATSSSTPNATPRPRRLALEAAVKATRLLQDDPGLSISVIIGQVRSTAIDLLRGSGMTGEEARTALDAAVERAGAAP